MPSDCPVSENQTLGRRMVASRMRGDNWCVGTKSGNDFLGLIEWHGTWKQFVFRPVDMAEFSGDCLAAIAAFMTKLDARREGA